MMEAYGPCPPAAVWFPAFNVVMNVFQAIVLAVLAQRAVRKNREDAVANENGRK